MLPTNILVQQGRISAVIDFDFLGIGDPAWDLIAAWSVFSLNTREIFRATLAIGDATWMGFVSGLVVVAKRMINEVLEDF